MNVKKLLLPGLLTLISGLMVASEPARLEVDAGRPGHAIAPTLWGIFFEDINLSADGGIYPELVRNRSFEDSEKPDHWTLAKHDGATAGMSIDTRSPLTPFNRRSLRLEWKGGVALANDGYWGMNVVEGEKYRLRLSARGGEGFRGPLKVWLEGKSGHDLAHGELSGVTDRWTTLECELTARASDPAARFGFEFSGEGVVWLDMVSLMPVRTWGRSGLRPDLCEMLAALQPAFLRFPGGCWVEGDDVAHMYNWKKTVGDPANRIPLWNIWQYWATHGLGYHEYLLLCEDLGAEPLFCINVGMSHREVVPLDQMGPWIQDALDAIEYANGPVTSVWGSLRARNGHPEPFHLKYLEIGNENGGPAYHERWELFHRALKAKHPEIQLIANVWGGYPTNVLPEIIDEHYYNNPEFFIAQAGKYDSYDRRGPKVFVGEYAVTSGAGLGNLRGAIGEAAFMTGLERNSDVVVMAAYAPLFCNANHKRWPINLINFDSSRAFGIPSYYVQALFSQHRGDVTLPVEVTAPLVSSQRQGGAIGVGTWATRAEFKDIRVTRGGETLYSCDFADGTTGWKMLGNGNWRAGDGLLRQSANDENVRAITGDVSWTNYTYSLKARKLGGAEGFLILFGVQNPEAKSWWNLGGWGNKRHAIEMGGVLGNEVDGSIETGRWYDIRVELEGDRVRCFLDNRLVHDVKTPVMRNLHASASRDNRTGDVILKVVNAGFEPQETALSLAGLPKLAPTARVITLTHADPTAENTLDEPRKVAPQEGTFEVKGPAWTHTFPANSLTILRLKPAAR